MKSELFHAYTKYLAQAKGIKWSFEQWKANNATIRQALQNN